MSLSDKKFVAPKLSLGVYVHYKNAGLQYEVIGVGFDTESEQPVVIYKPLYESAASYWVRPYDMFVGTVTVNGEQIPRFKKLKIPGDGLL